jgi:hypothetical protein
MRALIFDHCKPCGNSNGPQSTFIWRMDRRSKGRKLRRTFESMGHKYRGLSTRPVQTPART